LKKILALLSMLCLIPLTIVAVTSNSATADGCGPERHTSSSTGKVGGGNLKIAGRPLIWVFSVDSRDCDGYDLITHVAASLSKDGTGCQAVLGKTDGYKFNPNALGAGRGSVDGGEKWVDCNPTAGNYAVTYPSYEDVRIGQYMDDNQRCLNFTFTVDIQAQADAKFDNADAICFNGK
jgi:hypothetical protein